MTVGYHFKLEWDKLPAVMFAWVQPSSKKGINTLTEKTQAPVALITGSARRIGAAIAKYLHQNGFHIIIHHWQSSQEAQALANQLNSIKAESACIFSVDLLEQDSTFELIQSSLNWAGRLDLLVNNASVFKQTDLTALNTDWNTMFQLNVKVPFELSQHAYPYLAATQGSIINLTDIHADKPLKGYAVYCQTKAALSLQTKALALEFSPRVRVNAIAPGAIIWPEGENALSKTKQQNIIEKTALKQHGHPDYIAQAVLAFADNPFVTGEILRIDGGRTLL